MKINKNNYIIGVTGGIGAGKSTVLYILENSWGAKVYQADRVSRALIMPDGSAYEDVVALLGNDILTDDGLPDREAISKIVFRDPEKLSALEDIIHPAVKAFLLKKAKTRKGLLVFEAALPREGGFDELCDEIWYIRADAETRIQRLEDTRGYSREKSLEIISAQLGDEEFRSLCDVEIDNSGSLEELEIRIKDQIKRIKKKTGADI